jgi:hypothetical protein
MGKVKVYTNHHKRELLYFWELDEARQAEARDKYDYTDHEELQYFVYRDVLYSLEDFMAVHNRFYNPNPPAFMSGWDGYLTDTFFSGVLIKYPVNDCGDTDYDYVVVATFIS